MPGAAGAGDRDGELVRGARRPRAAGASSPPSARRRPDRDGRRAASPCAREHARVDLARAGTEQQALGRGEHVRRRIGMSAARCRLYATRGAHARSLLWYRRAVSTSIACRPRSRASSRAIVGADGVIDAPGRARASTSATATRSSARVPELVVLPRTTDEVARVRPRCCAATACRSCRAAPAPGSERRLPAARRAGDDLHEPHARASSRSTSPTGAPSSRPAS